MTIIESANPLDFYFDLFTAVLGFLLAIYFGYAGMRRYQGHKFFLPNEYFGLWLMRKIKGNKFGDEIEKGWVNNQKRNKILGGSWIFGSGLWLLIAVVALLALFK